MFMALPTWNEIVPYAILLLRAEGVPHLRVLMKPAGEKHRTRYVLGAGD
jgi:hypothetical protein